MQTAQDFVKLTIGLDSQPQPAADREAGTIALTVALNNCITERAFAGHSVSRDRLLDALASTAEFFVGGHALIRGDTLPAPAPAPLPAPALHNLPHPDGCLCRACAGKPSPCLGVGLPFVPGCCDVSRKAGP